MLYMPLYYTLEKIPKYRQQFIDIRLSKFLKKYKSTKIPLDSVKLLKEIKKPKTLKFIIN